MTEEYYGHTNYNTYLFNLYFYPETVDDLYAIKDYLEEEIENITCLFLKNIIDISDINYKEIEANIIENNIYIEKNKFNLINKKDYE